MFLNGLNNTGSTRSISSTGYSPFLRTPEYMNRSSLSSLRYGSIPYSPNRSSLSSLRYGPIPRTPGGLDLSTGYGPIPRTPNYSLRPQFINFSIPLYSRNFRSLKGRSKKSQNMKKKRRTI